MRLRFAVLPMILIASACSGESREQIASTTAMGAAIGIPGGPIGIAAGTLIGAAAGVIMPVGTLDRQQVETR
jgi:hypothetical protein